MSSVEGGLRDSEVKDINAGTTDQKKEKMETIEDETDDSADEEEYTQNLKNQRSELVQEVEEEGQRTRCGASCEVVTRYLVVEQTKKQRALKIGIFTVFLVVMCMTMLKSVVDVSPIIFVKIGQDQVGAIDYTMTSPSGGTAELDGNINWYAIDPFQNPFNFTESQYSEPGPSSYDKGLRIAKLIDPEPKTDTVADEIAQIVTDTFEALER